MSDELKNRAKSLKDSSPGEALVIYKQIWQENQEGFNHYDALYAIQCSRKTYDPDFVFVNQLLEKFSEDEIVLGLGGWYVFDQFIKGKEKLAILNNQSNILMLLNHLNQKDLSVASQYPCPFTIIAFELVEALSDNLFKAEKILEVLSLIKPEFLSRIPESYEHEKRGTIEKMSPYEKYYSFKTKALIKLEKYEDCLADCENALETIDSFHYDNQLWFSMRKALCWEHLGELEKSEGLFKELIESKEGGSKWFLFRDLAVLYFESENYSKAWKFSIDSALLGNDAKFLIKLYYLQARIMHKLGRTEQGKIFGEMLASILKENEWRVHVNYMKIFNYYQIQLSDALPVKQQHKKLKDFLYTEKYKDRLQLTGTINVIHKNGKSGFIMTQKGDQYFFGKNDLVKSMRNLDSLKDAKVSFYEGAETEKGKTAEAVSILEMPKNDLDQYIGKTYTGKITKIAEIGIFVNDICNGMHGLIHKSKLSDDFMQNYNFGDKIQVKVKRINKKGQIDLNLAN